MKFLNEWNKVCDGARLEKVYEGLLRTKYYGKAQIMVKHSVCHKVRNEVNNGVLCKVWGAVGARVKQPIRGAIREYNL